MKYSLLMVLLLSLVGCSDESKPVSVDKPAKVAAPTKEASVKELAPIMAKERHVVLVNDVLDSGGYTYVQAVEDGLMYWIAGPQSPIKVGETLRLSSQMWMDNFSSKTMKKSFERIMFVASFKQSPAVKKGAKESLPYIAPLAPINGSMSIKDIHAQSEKFSGKTITVHAKIVKASFGIMKKNWIHVIDGSSQEDDGVITATTLENNLREGDEIILTGKLTTKKDFGYGYFYKVIIEDATVKPVTLSLNKQATH